MNIKQNRQQLIDALRNNNTLEIERLKSLVDTQFLFHQLRKQQTQDAYLLAPLLPESALLSVLGSAAREGDMGMIQQLVTLCDPSARDNRALQEAAAGGQLECIKFLLPLSNLASSGSGWDALAVAAYWGRLECVKYLIHHFDPQANEQKSLRQAAEYAAGEDGDMACVEFLYSYCNPRIALEMAIKEGHYSNEAVHILEFLVAQCNREQLQDAIGPEIKRTSLARKI